MGEVRSGTVPLQSYDRFAAARELDLGTLRTRRIKRPEGHGWYSGLFAFRLGRLHALVRDEDGLKYVCGRSVWSVDDAHVERRVVWPFRFLTFRDEHGGEIGKCAWPDWEIARRWFIPTDGGLDVEDFDWSKLVRGVLNDVGRSNGLFRSARPKH